jgi:hypothetical protein
MCFRLWPSCGGRCAMSQPQPWRAWSREIPTTRAMTATTVHATALATCPTACAHMATRAGSTGVRGSAGWCWPWLSNLAGSVNDFTHDKACCCQGWGRSSGPLGGVSSGATLFPSCRRRFGENGERA